MKRKQFLKILVGTAAVQLTPSWAEEPAATPAQPYSKQVPTTPFDAPAGSWTLAVLPDTQYYSRSFPEVFTRQTEWLVRHRETHRIQFVAHEGDLVNNPTHKDQWENARKSMGVLMDARLPFSVLPGNHDLGTQDGGKTDSRITLLNDYFKVADYKNSENFGVFEADRIENSWHEITTPTGKHLLFALEFGPRDEVLAWANDLAAKRDTHKVIVVTHAYLSDKSTRFQAGNPPEYPFMATGSVNDGQQTWEKFISKNRNIQLVLNGHVCGTGVGRLTSEAPGGNRVHQLLANFQDNSPKDSGTVHPARGYGGGGFMRLLRYLPDGQTVQVKTYSPWYDQWLVEPEHQFDLKLA